MKLFFALAFTVSCLLAQTNNSNIKKLNGAEANLAWSAVSFLVPVDLPPITDGGLLVEAQTNDSGVRVVAVYRQPGQYLLEGTRCNGRKTEIDEWQIDPSPELYTNYQVSYDSQAAEQGIRSFGCFTSMSLLRIYSGTIQRSEVNLDRWNDVAPKPLVRGESVNGETYTLTFDTLPADAVVILGRNMIGKIRPVLGGSSISFERRMLSLRGPTTLTVCTTKDRCVTTTYERKFSAEVDAVNPGKG